MTGIEAPRIRLRPGVAVTPLRAGLHLRGRDGSVTLEGSRGLPLLWELLAERLGEEDDRGGKEDPAHPANTSHRADRPRPRLDPADPRVESALAALTAQLRAHDLLAECPAHRTCPAGVAEPAPWLGASTYRPGPAAAALAAARPVVAAADPAGPLATALISALERAGTRPQVHRDTGLPTDRVVAAAEVRASPVAVAVGRTAGGGFVTAPADPGRARSDAESIAARLSPGSSSGSGPQSGSASSGTTSPTAAAPAALTALLAGAAAQRLLCAVAGLPDPAVREEDPLLLPDRPAVLVAEARPPHASYHPWLTGPVDPAAPSPPLPATWARHCAVSERWATRTWECSTHRDRAGCPSCPQRWRPAVRRPGRWWPGRRGRTSPGSPRRAVRPNFTWAMGRRARWRSAPDPSTPWEGPCAEPPLPPLLLRVAQAPAMSWAVP